MSAYGTDSEGLESQLERLIGKEVAEDSRTNISRIADLQISIQKRSEALYSGLVVMIILLVSSLYFVSHRAKIIKSRQCPNNEYDASDNIVHLNNIRDELLSTINKSTDAVGIVATLDKFRT
jgi:hypothetical protein